MFVHAPRAIHTVRIGASRNAFTLIELLVVIVVITLLASLVAPNVFRHVGTARDGAARAQIEMIGAALDAYRLDLGRYPTTEEGLAALTQRPAGTNSALWRGPYLRRAVPRDPWSHPYVYTSPGVASQAGYDLASYGADGAPGGTADAADITSWKE
jgi:general secretion pathway protein G